MFLHFPRVTEHVRAVISLAAIAGLAACVVPITLDAEQAPVDRRMPATAASTPAADGKERPAGWTEVSHSNDVDPNYAVVFPVDAVNTITMTIAPEDWAAMQANMEEINAVALPLRNAVLEKGADLSVEERAALLPEIVQQRAAELRNAAALTATTALTTSAAVTGGEEEAAAVDDVVADDSPMWVPATISFQGQEWTHVGVRYKGVSSMGPWVLGDLKLPFKFDFDEFEDDYPAIKNQRFFGFKQLALANNFQDPTGMRDTLVYDLLDGAGLPSLQTAPYEIVLDYGEGPIRLGLYTVGEVVDDTGVPAYFGSDDGNIYEGDGPGATLATSHADKLESSFQKKNNEDEADWSDIHALYDALHDESRITDPAKWRAGLESVFDVDGFLAWLGIRALVGHGDVFVADVSAHNFYLYNDPATGRLTWISWDHNFTFDEDWARNVTLDKPTDRDGPLVGYLLSDPVYMARYKDLLAQNFAGVASPEAVLGKVRTYADLIAPYAEEKMSAADYDAAVQALVDFVELRAPTIAAFLSGEAADTK